MKKAMIMMAALLLPMMATAEIRNEFEPIELSVPPCPIEFQSEYYFIGEGNTFRPSVEYHINYDAQGFISSVSVYSLNRETGAMELGYTQTITNNSHGDITSETITYADGSPQNQTTWTYTYDNQGRMTAYSRYWNGEPDCRREYYYADGPAASLNEVDSASTARKTMCNGRIFIRVGDQCFDTTGRKVN